MSFFESLSIPPPPPEDDEPKQPKWVGPPRGVISGESAQRIDLIRTDRVILRVGPFDCYPDGIEFPVRLWVRGFDDERWGNPLGPPLNPRGPKPSDEDFLRLGVLLADGSTWANTEWRGFDPDTEPERPVVLPRSGGGGAGSWRETYWMWPLPPEGPVEFYAAWPARGVEETSAIVDGTELRARAAEAEVVWED